MRLLAWKCVAFLVLFFPSLACAGQSTTRNVLDNGLTILVNEMPGKPSVALYAWVRTGSANEGKYLGSGITHFIEHLLFKGTKTRGPGVIADEVRSIGGTINAATSHDYTVYTLEVPKDRVAQGLDILFDMMQNAAFDAAEVEREREVVVKEIRMNRDKPDRHLQELVYSTAYHAHPYRHPIIGYEQIFRRITRDDLLDYYHTYYGPNNIILSVAGDVVPEDILRIAREKFSAALSRVVPTRNLAQEPDQICSREASEQYATDLTRVVVLYQGIPLAHPDVYALDVLASALGSGESSRFYEDLVKERRLVESVDAEDVTPLDRGFIEIDLVLKDQKPAPAIARVKALIDAVKKSGLRPDELEKVKRQTMAANIYGRQTPDGVAYRAAIEEALTGDCDFSVQYLNGVRRVTNEDIQRVARLYLTDDRLSTVIQAPVSTAPKASSPSAEKSGDITKVVLPNGLVLLLKRDPSLPIISISAALKGGMVVEPHAQQGLTTLTGELWGKGVAGKTPEMIAREVESLAGSLNTGGGYNTFSLEMSFLKEDTDYALGILESLFKAPTFPEKELALSKEDMRTALKARRDSIFQASSRVLLESLFKTHPRRIDSLGTEESLARITRQDVASWFEKFRAPKNTVVSIFGDIDVPRLKADILRRLGSVKGGGEELPHPTEAVPEALRVQEITMDKEQALVLMGFQGPNVFSADKYAFQVAGNVLGSSMSGRLFKRVREELGKAYAVGGSGNAGPDVGIATFYALTAEESIPKVRTIFEEELAKLAATPLSDKELEDAKAYLKNIHDRDLMTIAALGATCASDELAGLGFDHYRGYNAGIEAVTPQDVLKVAQKYLDVRHAALVITHAGAAPKQP
ncbi:MAG: insulinase family protein [Candidatus Omnitrophica bacterium]|nr:insulinase family protein [Candidatus Omnitrophota bacterium]